MITVVIGHWPSRQTDVHIWVLAKSASSPLKVGEFHVDPIAAARGAVTAREGNPFINFELVRQVAEKSGAED